MYKAIKAISRISVNAKGEEKRTETFSDSNSQSRVHVIKCTTGVVYSLIIELSSGVDRPSN